RCFASPVAPMLPHFLYVGGGHLVFLLAGQRTGSSVDPNFGGNALREQVQRSRFGMDLGSLSRSPVAATRLATAVRHEPRRSRERVRSLRHPEHGTAVTSHPLPDRRADGRGLSCRRKLYLRWQNL